MENQHLALQWGKEKEKEKKTETSAFVHPNTVIPSF